MPGCGSGVNLIPRKLPKGRSFEVLRAKRGQQITAHFSRKRCTPYAGDRAKPIPKVNKSLAFKALAIVQ